MGWGRVTLLVFATFGMALAPASAMIIETRGATGLDRGPRQETAVEGHSSILVFENVTWTNRSEEQYAAAVAVLVRERLVAQPLLSTFSASASTRGPLPMCRDTGPTVRFPGVTWFNDQYLVRPRTVGVALDSCYRFPCTGAVLAVPYGLDGDLLVASIENGTRVTSLNEAVRYAESFLIPSDPNGFSWIVDKFTLPGREATHSVWAGAILNRANAPAAHVSKPDGVAEVANPVLNTTYEPLEPLVFPYSTPDDGGNCQPREDRACGMTCLPGASPPSNYPCPDPDCEDIRYNAILLFDLPVGNATGARDHRTPTTDASGCDANATDYPCPSGDDDREGDSHPFGAGPEPSNHGGSADCDGLASTERDTFCHATFLVNITYGIVQREKVPEVRRFGTARYQNVASLG